MDDMQPLNAAEVLWHMDECQLSSVDSSVLLTVLPSILKLVQTFGYRRVYLQAHYTLEQYRVQSHEQYEMCYVFHVQVERHSQSTTPQLAVRSIWDKILSNLESYRAAPLFLITGNGALLECVLQLFQSRFMQATSLVVCTSLPADGQHVTALVEWGAAVYQWTPEAGVNSTRVSLDWNLFSPADLHALDQVAPLMDLLETDGRFFD